MNKSGRTLVLPPVPGCPRPERSSLSRGQVIHQLQQGGASSCLSVVRGANGLRGTASPPPPTKQQLSCCGGRGKGSEEAPSRTRDAFRNSQWTDIVSRTGRDRRAEDGENIPVRTKPMTARTHRAGRRVPEDESAVARRRTRSRCMKRTDKRGNRKRREGEREGEVKSSV